ncbi:helix-turn-helix transcriptional regulator [Rhodococcus sp. D2-41]|uniref:helix-turn-helix domain-containing protein n=1 Tax=Speluncibacter jeojiensis TaxID=2710754 RepID=UPI00240F9662|nr:helix-turn-helix transcriptional regulator [Rhodococcus sp. D2-41]MDG3012495.1 helix-turn-helix transcriptional regulator [Rhodococcus sp. D2-41]
MDTQRELSVDAVRAAIGTELRVLRARQDLSREQVVEATGISLSAIRRLEKGLRDLDIPQLIALADVLQTTPAAFMEAVQNALTRAGE